MTKEPTVLIIDDDPSARETLEMLLIPEGYDLVFAQNGQEGFATALEILPDVVLCDVMMPGMDGFEVCRRVRAEHQLAEVPFILLSALDDRASKLRGLAVGADEFISKPLDSVELRMRLRTITRLARFRRLPNERGWLSRISEHTEDGYLVLEPDGSIAAANHQAPPPARPARQRPGTVRGNIHRLGTKGAPVETRRALVWRFGERPDLDRRDALPGAAAITGLPLDLAAGPLRR